MAVLGVWSSSTSKLFVVNASNEAGIKFLAENKSNNGIITLDSGLQYKILKKGDGKFHPTIDSSCSCHYEGKLLDGTIFDSSYERNSPTSFAPNQVIKGWTEAMQLMVAGDKVCFYVYVSIVLLTFKKKKKTEDNEFKRFCCLVSTSFVCCYVCVCVCVCTFNPKKGKEEAKRKRKRHQSSSTFF